MLKLGRGPKMDTAGRRRPTTHRFGDLCPFLLYLLQEQFRSSVVPKKTESVIAFVLRVASVALVLVSVQQTVPYTLAEPGDAA